MYLRPAAEMGTVYLNSLKGAHYIYLYRLRKCVAWQKLFLCSIQAPCGAFAFWVVLPQVTDKGAKLPTLLQQGIQKFLQLRGSLASETSRGYSKPPHFHILRLRITVLTSISKTIYCVWNQQVTGPASCSWPPEVSTASLGRALSAASLASMAAIFEKASGSSTGASSAWWEWFEPLPCKGISWEYKCALFRFWNYIRSCIYMKHCFSQIW